MKVTDPGKRIKEDAFFKNLRATTSLPFDLYLGETAPQFWLWPEGMNKIFLELQVIL